jgi:hypothetical protein
MVAMKHFQSIAMIACLAFLVSCETTSTTGEGTQEAKRLAAIQQQKAQPQLDEEQANLWSAQRDAMNQDGNAAARY